MADETPSGGGSATRRLGAFVKKNRVPLALAGAGGGFLYLSHRGSGGGDSAPTTYGTIVPVMRELSENDESTGGGVGAFDPIPGDDTGYIPGDGVDPTLPEEPPLPAEPALPPEPALAPEAPAPTPVAETPTATAQPVPVSVAAPPANGVTISGTTIPGAISRTASGGGTNSFGKYTDWLVKFPSGSGHYYHYYQDEHGRPKDKVTGPHDPKGTIPAAAKGFVDVASPAPAPAPAPTTTAPRPGTASNPPGPIERPAGSTYQDWYAWQADGDVHTYRVYTSGPPRLPDYRKKEGNFGKAPTSLSATLRNQGWTTTPPAGLTAVVNARFFKLAGGGTI